MLLLNNSSLLTLANSRKQRFPTFLLLLIVILCIPQFVSANPEFKDANALMRHIDRMWRGDSSHVRMTMSVNTSRYQRTMELESWSKGKEKSLIIIRSPKKDRGIATLKVDENIWNYLPKINRTTKVPASLMSGSWMGSHFTNDDLVKENTYEDDYTSSITFEGERQGKAVIEVTSIPKQDAAVVWGKVVTLIDPQNYTPTEALYYDEEQVLIRKMLFDNIITQNNRVIPTRLTLLPINKPKESTTVEYAKIVFDIALDDKMFSLQSLQKRR